MTQRRPQQSRTEAKMANVSLSQTKTRAAAAMSTGQHIEAIALYRQVLAAKPDDWKTVGHLGDAFAAVRDITAAAEHYKRAAEHYESIQHPLMAIALWKRMAQLLPKMIDIRVKLAKLHEQAGHGADAAAEYEAVIAALRKEHKGMLGETLVKPFEARLAALRVGTLDAAPPPEPTAAIPGSRVAPRAVPATLASVARTTEAPAAPRCCPHCGGVLP